jgi:hypothetical protein
LATSSTPRPGRNPRSGPKSCTPWARRAGSGANWVVVQSTLRFLRRRRNQNLARRETSGTRPAEPGIEDAPRTWRPFRAPKYSRGARRETSGYFLCAPLAHENLMPRARSPRRIPPLHSIRNAILPKWCSVNAWCALPASSRRKVLSTFTSNGPESISALSLSKRAGVLSPSNP